jgi:hypothetical protein
MSHACTLLRYKEEGGAVHIDTNFPFKNKRFSNKAQRGRSDDFKTYSLAEFSVFSIEFVHSFKSVQDLR